MTAVQLFGAILLSCLCASALHEVTHWLVAFLLGRRPRFDLREFAVFWEAPRTPTLGDWAVALAPVAVGLLAAAATLVAGWWRWWLLPALYLYGAHGALTNDLAAVANPGLDESAAETDTA